MKWFNLSLIVFRKWRLSGIFRKDYSLSAFPFSLTPLTMIRTITKTKSSKLHITISKSCVVVSLEANNRRCSVLCHSLIDCWTHFNNLLVYQPVMLLMLDFIHFFRHKRCYRNSYWYFNLHTVTTNLAYLSEIIWCPFRVAAAALSSLNNKKLSQQTAKINSINSLILASGKSMNESSSLRYGVE